ncbi:fructose-6-phosphate aldolase [Thermus thermamylovorans]|uniref:Probable transaldolase n=1 Tax=Thermus thermamylovorans TaxID=2509362 RepID=A0A4Q9B519_9DEIN|nr:fructose-6-phosphate aldolase [Thermus thermamylovorans]TBH21078.1 fructose-6-phosphate aldolase [Thermus thermamylovorans]
MELYLDTANLEEIREIAAWGVLSGVTTNPTLVAKEFAARGGQLSREGLEAHLRAICEAVEGPVSAEVTALDAEGMVAEGRRLAAIHPQIVVKLPTTEEGLKACKRLTAEGVRVNMTLVFSANQALLAARAGAAYLSPFLGRVDDISWDGGEVLREIVEMIQVQDLSAKVIAASIRHPRHVTEAALLGADIATLPHAVFKQLLKHPLTDIGLARFLADWERVRP